MKYVVSACLLGDNCKYNAGNNYDERVINYLKDKDFIKVCPEVLGGLGIPRVPSEIVDKRVINQDGIDVTDEYLKGAEETLEIVKKHKIDFAILKSKSPSCGCGKIYDGTFSNRLVDGDGITTRLLKENNVFVVNNEEIEKIKECV